MSLRSITRPFRDLAHQCGISSTDIMVASDCIEPGDTTWVLISTVLVLGMMPALALFEAGMLRAKNTLSIITQTMGGLTILSVLWTLFGYSLSFGPSAGGVIGSLEHAFWLGVDYDDCSHLAPTIPHACFALFQMMFAAITPLLMTGAFAERMPFKTFICLTVAFEVLVYYPVCHWVWGGGFLQQWGVLDFAGGIVVHTTAGVGSLVCAIMLGKRHNFHHYHGEFPPHNLPLAALGAALLWMGWFGFNGGSALHAGSVAVSAVVSTQLGCCVSATTWLFLSWYQEHPSVTALMNGALAGLAGITPATGFIGNQASLVLGFVLGISSYFGVHTLKTKLGIDDALDVSMVHGLTGVIGSLAIGICSDKSLNAAGADGWIYGNPKLLGYQVAAVLIVGVYSGIITYGLLKVMSKWMPLTVGLGEEKLGMDWVEHRQVAYHDLLVLEAQGSFLDEDLREKHSFPPSSLYARLLRKSEHEDFLLTQTSP